MALAVVLEDAHDNLVIGNDLRFNAGGLQLSAATGNRLESNNVSGSTGTGIEIDDSLGNVIVLNTANDNRAEGISIDALASPGAGNLLDRNTASGNSGNGIYIGQGGHTITANTADNNDSWGIYVAAGNTDGGDNRAAGNLEPLQCFGVACDGSGPPPPDATPPDTTIGDVPPDPSFSGSATFSFSGSDNVTPPAALQFECRLDNQDEADFVACVSPQNYTDLSTSTYTFEVRAVNSAGNADPTPASHPWTVSPPPDCGAPVTTSADADAWIDQNSSSNNFGSDSILKVQAKSSNNFRALVRFVLPADVPQGCIVQSATLRLYAASWKNGRTLQAIRLAGSWSENSVTWSNQPSTTGNAATANSGSGYREWSVAAQVQAMYDSGSNHGFLIRDANEGGGSSEQQFHSREKDESIPQLIITFAPAGG